MNSELEKTGAMRLVSASSTIVMTLPPFTIKYSQQCSAALGIPSPTQIPLIIYLAILMCWERLN